MAKKLQVFISSTYTDLKQERQAAVSAILKLGHIPAGMELFTAGDQSQWDTIKAWIDESDVYMLILGGRYGSIEPKSKLSYTELEYKYAVAQGKPFFAVVIREPALERKVQAHGTSVIELENGSSLTTFRKKVLSNISSFFDDEKDIRLSVYETLADFAANKNLVGWVPGNTVVDTLPLFDEIKKLHEENTLLRAKLSEHERRVSIESKKNSEFDELVDLLTATVIKVPKSVAEREGVELDLLTIFDTAQNRFATGFDNRSGMDAYDNFLFFTVGAKLKVYGLVQFEKIAGVQYRRCILTSKGEKFLGDLAKQNLKLNKNGAQNSVSMPEETAKNIEGPATTKKQLHVESVRTNKIRSL
jgi:hypothetical protein